MKKTQCFKQLRIVLAILSLVASSTLAFQGVVPRVQGQLPPLVAVDPFKIADTTVTSGTVLFNINITNSPSINLFVVQLSYNHTVMNIPPNGLDFTGGVMGSSPNVFLECIDGISVIHTFCFNPGVNGTIELGLSILGGVTPDPTNGLLFKLTLNVVGLGVSQIHFIDEELFNSGRVVPSQTADGYFSNIMCGSNICQPPLADFIVNPSKPLRGVPATFDASTSQATNPGSTVTTYEWSWGEQDLLATTTTNPVTQQTFNFANNYTVTLGVKDSYGVTGFKSARIDVIVPPDFLFLGGIPNFIGPLLGGQSATFKVAVKSVSGFSGIVSLSGNFFPQTTGSTPPTVYLAPASLKLTSGGSNSTQVTVSTTRLTTQGSYALVITGTSALLSHNFVTTVKVVAPSFVVSCDPLFGPFCSSIAIGQHATTSFPLFVSSYYGFTGAVSLSTTAGGRDPAVSFNPDSFTLKANGSAFSTVTVTTTGTPTKDYFFGLLGTSGAMTSVAPLLVTVVAPPFPPDFSVEAVPSVTIVAGTNATLPVTLQGLNGFSGQLALRAFVVPLYQPGSPLLTIQRKVSLATGSASAELNLSTSLDTVRGIYIVAITAMSSNGQLQTAALTVTVVAAQTPVIVQLHWEHLVSVERSGSVQTFSIGVYNPNSATNIYIRVRVTGLANDGTTVFVASSGTIQIPPQQTLANIAVSQAFDSQEVGLTFSFTAQVQWGVNPSSLPYIGKTAARDVPTTGLFTIVP